MPNELEAKARIKINKLLEEADWRFFDTNEGKTNIHLGSHIKYDDLGQDFEKVTGGFIDFLLLDDYQNPLVALEAKSEKLEQRRRTVINDGREARGIWGVISAIKYNSHIFNFFL